MQKIKFLGTIGILLLTGCASDTRPIERVHTATGLPRTAVLLTDREDSHLQGRINPNYGVSWTDYGGVQGSSNLLTGLAFQANSFAIGWTPFFSYSNVSAEDRFTVGHLLHAAYRIGGGRWRLTPQFVYGFSQNKAETEGCDRDAGVFGSVCPAGSLTARARADIEVSEVGFGTAIERKMGDSFWALVPMAYYTSVTATNSLDRFAASDSSTNPKDWNYSLLLLFGGSKKTLWSLGIGAANTKDFLAEGAKRRTTPVADLRWQF